MPRRLFPLLPTLPSDRADILVVLVTLTAPWMGGGHSIELTAALAVLMGTTMFLAPPKHGLPLPLNLLFLAFLGVLFWGLLPASWFSEIPSREFFSSLHGVNLPATVAPQPWLAFEAGLLGALYLLWLWFLLAREWTLPREALLALYAGGITFLAVATLACFWTGWKPPFWSDASLIGPFANRNHSANVIALGGVLALATFWRKKGRALLPKLQWLAALAVILLALLKLESRAGLLIFLMGCVGWFGISAVFSKEKRRAASGLAAVFVTLALLLVFAGHELRRFQRMQDAASVKEAAGARYYIQQDAFRLALDAPVVGIGAGQFAPVFSQHRFESAMEKRTRDIDYQWTRKLSLHPESDWLQLWIELGWLGMLVVGVGMILLFKECFPFKKGTDRNLRAALVLCVGLFLLHGFGDVVGHRSGTFMAAALFLALARKTKRPHESLRLQIVFRAGAVFAIALGAHLLLSVKGHEAFPTSASLERMKQENVKLRSRGKAKEALASAQAAAEAAPVDWAVHYSLGATKALIWEDNNPSILHFATTRALEPHSERVPFFEGRVWLRKKLPYLCVSSWAEALRRHGPHADAFFREMLATAGEDAEALSAISFLAGTDPAQSLMAQRNLPASHYEPLRLRLIAANVSLEGWSQAQKEEFFLLWSKKGDRGALYDYLVARPEWASFSWPWIAEGLADQNKYREACEMVLERSERPAAPTGQSRRSISQLQISFLRDPTDLVGGYSYRAALLAAGDDTAAMDVLLKLIELPNSPKYLRYLEFEAWAKQGEWQRAWNAWRWFKG